MFNTQRSQLQTRTQRGQAITQRGQSIVVALLVLLLLGLAGALFVTIIARNLINARHANRVVTADQYASAGITYADAQLSSSIDGADWRPPLQSALSANYLPTDARELARYNANAPAAANPSDPDLEYLQAGYARYNTGAGRFLLRVTYDPVNVNPGANGVVSPVPPGKYLKIESIGREGAVDPIDPTTYTNNRSTDRTQAYQVAYKPIGITDYARFETNPNKRSDIANLGVASQFYADNTDGGIATPGVFDFASFGSTGVSGTTPPTLSEYPVITTYGAPDAYVLTGTSLQPNPAAGSGIAAATGSSNVPGGGSIHANMPVRFFGTNVIYLNNAGAAGPLFQDGAEIAGDLLLDSYDQKASLNNATLDTSGTAPVGQQAALILNPTDLTKVSTTGTLITPSNDSQPTGDPNKPFDTQGGLIRDGSMQNDGAGLPRNITRLEPPLMDATDSASQMPRYRAIAMNSAPRPNLKNPDGTPYVPAANAVSASQFGYGKDIYVNNPNDTQPDSASIGGGSTLTDEWLNRTSALSNGLSKGNWNGEFYNPPGVSIILGQEIAPPANATTPGTYGIRLIRSAGDHFVGPDGTTNAGTQMDVKYSDLDTDPTGAASDNDIIIYAEGNVRVRGILSPNEGTDNTTHQQYVPRHITIVTDGTAYIEGNLLKGSPDSTISVLAHDYVCINTTQFTAGPITNDQPPTAVGDSLELPDGYTLTQQFGFGFPDPGAAVTATTPQTPTTQYGTNLALYVSGSTATGPGQADFDILDSAGNTVFSTPPGPMPVFGALTHLTFDLSGTTLSTLTAATGDSVFQLTVQKDPGNLTGSNAAATQNPLLERVAVLPMDIRIEAVLYAQTRSFFVIPGDWFNTNPADNLAEYLSTLTRPDLSANTLSAADFLSGSRFPLYGQPIDLKITIDGSVSEAQPADISAQTAWMQKWGWIPQYHGSINLPPPGATGTPEPAGHPSPTGSGNPRPAIGLQIIYNPQAGYPYDPANKYYLRSDLYGRPLPWTPKLPVSTGLLYSGQSGEAPLLQ